MRRRMVVFPVFALPQIRIRNLGGLILSILSLSAAACCFFLLVHGIMVTLEAPQEVMVDGKFDLR